ncbi:MAG: dihydrofolate reductase [Euryarchaeota archaeon]|jgi:dihydrofolate reductase|nr:dihydrofolate reductase [Euryarchaeota archaeon]MBT3970964.1 dihydrofolate reductase [Euryarchaeota archaeon]MBT4407853.1 dihydrofolate reductase [Euryarchaeota archaeon]MBT6645124.1 dihydrofolate reductase [Euryarchaeota archaeon]
MMRIVLLAAMDKNRAIGISGELPWHLSTDLQRFKERTLGRPIVMGRATFESIGRPLPGRTNIVLTRNTEWEVDGVSVVHDTESALEIAWKEGAEELCVIGGGQVYALFLGKADVLELTFVEVEVADADTWFPDWAVLGEWNEVNRTEHFAGENDDHNFTVVTLIRP